MNPKTALMLTTVAVLTGCVSITDKVAQPLDLDKATGVVTMGFFFHSEWGTYGECSSANWSNAQQEAAEICARWGYVGAVPVGPCIQSGRWNGYGAFMSGKYTRKYQCTTN